MRLSHVWWTLSVGAWAFNHNTMLIFIGCCKTYIVRMYSSQGGTASCLDSVLRYKQTGKSAFILRHTMEHGCDDVSKFTKSGSLEWLQQKQRPPSWRSQRPRPAASLGLLCQQLGWRRRGQLCCSPEPAALHDGDNAA